MDIQIKNPCQEKWENFTNAEGGRYCGACSKVVVDFTSMSDEEIVHYFNRQTNRTCGRFRSDQLRSYNTRHSSPKKFSLLWGAGLAGVLLFLSGKDVKAQSSERLKRGEVVVSPSYASDTTRDTSRPIKGTVLFADDRSSLPGVNVLIKGTVKGTVTDADGKFELEDVRSADVLVISFIGLVTKEVAIAAEHSELIVLMEADQTQLGGISVVAGHVGVTRKVSFRRWWGNVKGVFR